MPQGMRRKAPAKHPEVAGKPGEETQSVVLLRVVERNPVFQVCSRRGQFPLEEQVLSERPVGNREESRVMLALSQGEELIAHFPRGLQFRPHDVESDTKANSTRKSCGVSRIC